MRLGNVLLQVVDQAVNPRVAGVLRHRLGNELRLTAFAVRRHNHPTGDLVGNHAAKALTDDIQAAVQRGGGPGGGNNIVVIHIEGVDIKLDARKKRLEVMFKLPVGGRALAVENARIRQHKRPQTQPDDFRTVVSCLHQAVEQRLRRAIQHVLPVGHHHNIRLRDG